MNSAYFNAERLKHLKFFKKNWTPYWPGLFGLIAADKKRRGIDITRKVGQERR